MLVILIFFVLASLTFALLDCLMNDVKAKKGLLFLLIVLFAFLAMVRSVEVPDTEAYLEFFNDLVLDTTRYGLFHYTHRFEFGFEFFARILVKLNFSPRWILFTIAFCIGFLGAVTFRDERYPIITWLVFISFYGIYFSFIILRSGMSIVLFCFFVTHLSKNKITSLASLALAILFHESVLFALLIFITSKFIKRLHFRSMAKWILVFFIIYVLSLGNTLSIAIIQFMNSFIHLSIWTRFMYYVQDFEVPMFHVSTRLIFYIVIFLVARFIKERKGILAHEDTDKLVFEGILINLFLGSNTVTGRMADFLLIFIVFDFIDILKNLRIKLYYVKDGQKLTVASEGCELICDKTYIRFIVALILILINVVFIYRIAI